MLRVEGEKPRDAIGLHGCYKSGVARPETYNAERADQIVPAHEQIFVIGQEHESPLEEPQPLAGLGGRHAEAVLSSRWQARFLSPPPKTRRNSGEQQ